MLDKENWKIINRDYDEKSIRDSASVFTISNGYMAFKGDLSEFSADIFPTTIINGLFDQVDIFSLLRLSNRERRYLDPEYFDKAGPSPSVANLPNPLFTSIFIAGRQVSFKLGKVRDFQQRYDLHSGTYTCKYEFEDHDGRVTRISMRRFCDMEHVHRAYIRYVIRPLNYDDPMKFRSGIDAAVRSNITGERQIDVTNQRVDGDRLFLDAQTLSSKIKIHAAASVTLREPTTAEKTEVYEDEKLYFRFDLEAERNTPIVVDKAVALSSSIDGKNGFDCDISEELDQAVAEGFDAALRRTNKFWESLWRKIDVKIEGDEKAQLYLRFALYHLAAAAPRHSGRLSVPCKLLTGEHYQGTTFYDTDLYIEPFYIFTNPEWARNMLSYRCCGLTSAKRIAEDTGFKGAKFAWQAGPEGIECLGDWYRFTRTNIHINADIAYSLMLYYRATGDIVFMTDRGIDILVETSRFYASRASYNNANGGYDFHNVTGPDEGHVACTNEFYTNYLASKNLSYTCEFLEMLKENHPEDYTKIVARLHVSDEEVEIWSEISRKLTLNFDEKTKIYEQCEGFYKLKPVPENFSKHRDEWFATVFPYQAINQPDVVMALVLFRDEFPEEIKRANWEFYKPRSMNFSSMSYFINSIMAKEMGEMEDAHRDFIISAGMDLDPALTGRNDTHEGLHGTALGGAWMAAVFGFGGITLGQNGLTINPKLPAKWKSLAFRIMFRGELMEFKITRNTIEIAVGDKASLSIPAVVAEKETRLESGNSYTFLSRSLPTITAL